MKAKLKLIWLDFISLIFPRYTLTVSYNDTWGDKDDQEFKLSQQQEFSKRKKLMSDTFHVLNTREKQILTARRLSDEVATLEDLSKKYKISRERVRQIENKAFEKLQKHMLNSAKSKNLLPVN